MSEERFDRLDAKFAVLTADVSALTTDVAVLKTDVAGLKTDVAGLKTDVAELRVGQVDLGHQMRLLHEDVIDRIKAIPDSREVIRQEIRNGLAEIREEFNRRLDPLERTVRDHSLDIARLKEARS